MYIIHKTGIFSMNPYHLDSVNIIDAKPGSDDGKKIIRIYSTAPDNYEGGYTSLIELSCDSAKAAEAIFKDIVGMLISTGNDKFLDWRPAVSSVSITEYES